ncbi:MAG: DUF4190 domain-containing protein [Polyangiaceae bacterium]
MANQGWGPPPGGGNPYNPPPGGGNPYGGNPYGGNAPPPGNPYGPPPGAPYGPSDFGPPPGGTPGGFPGGPPPQATESLAWVSLGAGIAGVPLTFCCSVIGLPVPIVALVCGFMALSKIKAEPYRLGGKNLAIAGIVLAGVGLAALVLRIVLGFAQLGMSSTMRP